MSQWSSFRKWSFPLSLIQASLFCFYWLSSRVCICGYPRQQMRRYKGISTRLTVTSEFLVQLITGIHYALWVSTHACLQSQSNTAQPQCSTLSLQFLDILKSTNVDLITKILICFFCIYIYVFMSMCRCNGEVELGSKALDDVLYRAQLELFPEALLVGAIIFNILFFLLIL